MSAPRHSGSGAQTQHDESGQFENIIDDLTEFVVRWLPDGTRIFVNDAYCRYFQSTREEILGTSFYPLITEEHRDQVRARIARLTPENPLSVGEHQTIRPDGRLVWQQWSDRGFFDDSGNLVELLSTGRDVTDSGRVNRFVRELNEHVSGFTGEAFFEHLVAFLADWLAVDYCFVGTWTPEQADVVHTTAVCSDGRPMDGFTYALADTPCRDVAQGKVCFYAERVAESFPKDELLAEMQIQCYAGIPLLNSRDEPIGILVALSREPCADEERLTSLLRFCAMRCAAELERQRTDTELRGALEEIERLKDQLEVENISLREEIRIDQRPGEIVGSSPAFESVLYLAQQVAETDSTVLLLGETGTGKEVVARLVHNLSRRKARAFVAVNCAALPPTLIESELFGHERGAFTDATARRIGRFEVADGATLFLDEIGDLPLELQARLLRAIQDGQFERVGGNEVIKVDVRLITATHRNLERLVEEGKFRSDLFYRLNVFPIELPALRDRKEDIPELIWAFVQEFGQKMGKRIESIPKSSMQRLQEHTWPGNVRELRNVIERAMIRSPGSVLDVELPRG